MSTKANSNHQPKILVMIPVYNCENQLKRVLAQLRHFKTPIEHILVIDNQSTDQTVLVAMASLKKLKQFKVTLIQNQPNIGLGGSHLVGFEFGQKHGFTHLIVLHGDDQAKIQDLWSRLTPENLQLDAFLGSRFMIGSKLIGYSLIRQWGNLAINKLISLVTHQNITDTGSGLNLYKLAAFKPKILRHFPSDLTFNVYLLLWSIFSRHQLKFFPISWQETDQVSQAKVWRQGFKILKLLWEYWRSPKLLFKSLLVGTSIKPKTAILFERV